MRYLKTQFDKEIRLSDKIFEHLAKLPPEYVKIYVFIAAQTKGTDDLTLGYISSSLFIEKNIAEAGLNWLCENGFIRTVDDQQGYEEDIKKLFKPYGTLELDPFIAYCFDKGYSVELINEAITQSIEAIGTIYLFHVRSILDFWESKGIRTAESARKFAKEAAEKEAPKKETSYSLEEWQEFAMNFDPTTLP